MSTSSPPRQAVNTPTAPTAVAAYSQAIISGNLIFVSGQIPLDPATGQMVEGTIADLTRQVFRNLTAVLEAAGSSLDRIVKTTVYLADMGDFAAMNAVYAGYFQDPLPARSTVAVAALPRSARIEIDAIATR
jgi:2-iminobutanoate/2-iminopropanoate deaminase